MAGNIVDGEGKGGVSVVELEDGGLSLPVTEVNGSGDIVSPTTSGATELKQDDVIARLGEVQDTPTAFTLLRRLKDLLTGIVLAAGNAIIGKVKIVDDSGNVIGSLNNGLNVHVADSHEEFLNRYFVAFTGDDTTLSAGALAGDTSIDIQAGDYATYAVGNWLELSSGNTHEPNFVKITAKPGSPALTLDRPLDNTYPNGSDVKEVTPNIAAAAGSLAVPVSYKLTPAPNETMHINRFLIAAISTAESSIDEYHSLGELTNGVVVRVCCNGVYSTLTNWKKDQDMMEDMFDLVTIEKPPAGKFGQRGRWTLTSAGSYKKLDGATSDFAEMLIQDNLTGSTLEDLQIKPQGHFEQ